MGYYIKIILIILAVSSASSPLFAKTSIYNCTLTNAKNTGNWVPQTISFEKKGKDIKLKTYSSIMHVGSVKASNSSNNFTFLWNKKVTSAQNDRFNVRVNIKIDNRKINLFAFFTGSSTFSHSSGGTCTITTKKPKTVSEVASKLQNYQICRNATFKSNGVLKWYKMGYSSYNDKYIKEANKRGLSCGVSNSPLKQAFNDFDANGRINIQKALTDLKLYTSSIDGSYGPGTHKAIEKYLQDIMGVITLGNPKQNPNWTSKSDNLICILATRKKTAPNPNKIKIWKTAEYAQGYVKEARARGLTCGINGATQTTLTK